MAVTHYHIDDAAAGGGDGSTWGLGAGGVNAMNMTDFETWWAGTGPSAGDRFYFMGGDTYTMNADISTSDDFSVTEPVCIFGVASTPSKTTNVGAAIDPDDLAQGDDRPLFDDAAGAYMIMLDNYNYIESIRIESSDTYGIRVDQGSYIINCKSTHDYGSTTAHYCFYIGGLYGHIIDCEATGEAAPNDRATGFSGYVGCHMLFCYAHDLTYSAREAFQRTGGGAATIAFCIADNCATGIESTSDDGCLCFCNTFYSCTDGITATDDYGWVIVNNIFSVLSNDAITWGTAGTLCNYFNYNHFYSISGDEWVGTPKKGDNNELFCDWNPTSGDPKFTAPAAGPPGDFSLQSDSPCIGAGMKMELGVG